MAVRHRVTKSSVKTPPPPSAKLKSIGVMYHGYRLRFLFTISRTRYSAEVSRILPSTFPERVYSKNMESYTFERTYGGGGRSNPMSQAISPNFTTVTNPLPYNGRSADDRVCATLCSPFPYRPPSSHQPPDRHPFLGTYNVRYKSVHLTDGVVIFLFKFCKMGKNEECGSVQDEMVLDGMPNGFGYPKRKRCVTQKRSELLRVR